MPSFRRVLDAVDDAWHNRRDEVDRQADALADAVSAARRCPPTSSPTAPRRRRRPPTPPRRRRLRRRAPARSTGRGRVRRGTEVSPAPTRRAVPAPPPADRRGASLAMATTTLGAMASGGIYDHVGGGFARYSTDATWTVPHFEKMLYDQAGLVRALPPRLAGHRRRTVAPGGRGDRRLRSRASCAPPPEGCTRPRTPTPRAKRAASTCGRRPRSTPRPGPSRRRRRRLVRGQRQPATSRAGPSCAARPAPLWPAPPDVEEARARLVRGARPAGPSRARRQGAHGVERHVRVRPGRGGRRHRTSRLGRRRRGRIGEFLLAESRDPGSGRWLRSWQDGRARHLAYAGDYAWLVDFFTRLAELTGRPCGWSGPGKRRGPCSSSAGDDSSRTMATTAAGVYCESKTLKRVDHRN